MERTSEDRRDYFRIRPSKNAVMAITDAEEDVVGLVRDESEGGCAGIFHRDHLPWEVGDRVTVTTRRFQDIGARIIWMKPVDKRFTKVGFEYRPGSC